MDEAKENILEFWIFGEWRPGLEMTKKQRSWSQISPQWFKTWPLPSAGENAKKLEVKNILSKKKLDTSD